MGLKIKTDKRAVKALQKLLTKDLKAAKINREMRSPMTQAGKIVVKKAKSNVKGENPHVAKAIKQRAKTYKNGVVVRVIGVEAYGRDVKAAGKSKPNSAVIAEGKKIEIGASDKAAHPFMRPALDQTKSQTQKVIASGYNTAIDKVIAKAKTGKL